VTTAVDESFEAHDPYAAEVRELWKSFGGIPVLKGVNITLFPGEIHALVGGNGAGKSTLMKSMTGVVEPDEGEIIIRGNRVRNLSPRKAHANSIYMVPQEPALFPNLSVRENITLSLAGTGVGEEAVDQTARELAPHIDLAAPASELSIADQQLVELIRGIVRRSKVLIVDEPTAALTARETESLFVQLRYLASKGVGIFYVTHRLNEIFELCNRVSVLRDGALVMQSDVREIATHDIVSQMIPDKAAGVGIRRSTAAADSAVLLEVDDLAGDGFSHVSFCVRAGEIVGIAGVIGAGRTEVAETIFGARKGTGRVVLCGTDYTHRSPKESYARGLSYVAEDRHLNGVFLNADIVDNVTSTVPGRVSSQGWTSRSRQHRVTSQLMESLDLQAGALSRHVANLSGGNQQKVALGKALAPNPKVLILDEPSRGVDVGARADLYRAAHELAESGTAVVVVSSDFEEVCAIASRVLVMRNGRITTELTGDGITMSSVRNASFGLAPKEEAA